MALQDVIERIRGLDDPPNEEATKFQMVLPILKELGWDAFDQSLVRPEYAVGKGKVDLALMAPRKGAVAFVEVKAADKRPGDHVDQVLGYAFNEGVDICALTTGREWWLYLPREKGRPDERRFAELTIGTDPIDQLVDDFETYLGRNVLLDGKSERRARQVLAAKLDSERLNSELPRIWDDMLSSPPQELLELIEARVFRSIRLRPSGEQVTQFLNAQAGAVVPTEVRDALPPKRRETERAPEPNVDKEGRSRAPSIRPKSFHLWGREHSVKSWQDVWVGVAQAVHDRDPSRFGALVGRPRGKRSFVELDRGAVRSPRQMGRYWLDGHGSAEAHRARCDYLLELAGYENDLTYTT